MEETSGYVPVYWQQGKFQFWANCLMCEPWVPRTSLKATPPPVAVSSVLTNRPRPICHKRIGASRMVSHTRHNSKLILDRKDSPPGCLHMALAYKYIISVYRRHDMSLCTSNRVNSNYEGIPSCAGCQYLTRDPESQGNSATHCCVERPNHSAMTYPS